MSDYYNRIDNYDNCILYFFEKSKLTTFDSYIFFLIIPMNKIDIQVEFLNALNKKNIHKYDLVTLVSDILHIERESASRRLRGKVLFTIHEVGLLAKELNISLDALIYKDSCYEQIPFIFKYPMTMESMDILYDKIDACIEQMIQISKKPSEYVYASNLLPLFFFAHYQHLTKFMFFKWGYYLSVGTDEFNDYPAWKIPQKLENILNKVKNFNGDIIKTVYIWDETLISSLVNEIDKFYRIHMIGSEEKNAITNDVKVLLKNLEMHIKGIQLGEPSRCPMEFYVSSKPMGLTATYIASQEQQLQFLGTDFAYSPFTYNHDYFSVLKNWIYSQQSFSILLSQSGQVYRRLFFAKQSKIIDSIF